MMTTEPWNSGCHFGGCHTDQRNTGCKGPIEACGTGRALRCLDLLNCLESCEEVIRTTVGDVQVPRWKRAFDLACVLFTAPGWAPLMALIALFVKCVSPGPVFFRQERVGLRGQHFGCLKFRTMKVNADAAVHQEHLRQLIATDRPMTKMDALGDSRLIWGGRFLRSSGLDELPQLLNVLRGEMSIVGPRPCTPFECRHYEEWHRKRFNVLPGLTGLWQVNGKNNTTFRQMILLDLYYALHLHPWLDCVIMWKTLGVLAAQITESHSGVGAPPAAYPSNLKKKQVPVA